MDRIRLSYLRRESFKGTSMIIIGYEGTIRDPKYFQYIEEDLLEPRKAFIHPLPTENGESAPIKVLERVRTFVEDPSRGVNIESNDIIWFVLDVDRHPLKQFDDVYLYSLSDRRINLAISNPCFEIWLWMHFDDVDNASSVTSKSLKKELHDKQNELRFNGNYIPLIPNAIKRAYKVDKSKTYFPEEKSTKVHLLVENLLQYSKK